jgi:hypothetical protein
MWLNCSVHPRFRDRAPSSACPQFVSLIANFHQTAAKTTHSPAIDEQTKKPAQASMGEE